MPTPHGPGWAAIVPNDRRQQPRAMYIRPTLRRFGTLRELTQGGSAANYDFGNASSSTCDIGRQNCWAPIPNSRS
jgi:hypothetical protein